MTLLKHICLLFCWQRLIGMGVSMSVVWGLVACSPRLNWREVRPPDAQGLELSFPCRPTTQSRQVRLPNLAGQPVKMYVMTCEADGVTWAVSYFDAGTPTRWRDALTAWQSALQDNLLAMSASSKPMGRMQDLRMNLAAIQIAGSTPHPDANTWWATGTRPVNLTDGEPVGVRVWHFTKGLWVFQASVWAPALQPDDPRWVTFSNGIHFLP
jgi:YD repeat-containing protein